jgi:hypothetical protein
MSIGTVCKYILLGVGVMQVVVLVSVAEICNGVLI